MDNQVTAALPYNATANDVQNALGNLSTIGSGNVSVTGNGTTAAPFVVEFQNGLAGVNVDQLVADGSQLITSTLPPVAVSANYSLTENTTLDTNAQSLAGVLANDSDPNGLALIAELDTAPPSAA